MMQELQLDYAAIGARLRQAREQANLTLQDAAMALGMRNVNALDIGAAERGAKELPAVAIVKLALKVYQCNLSETLYGPIRSDMTCECGIPAEPQSTLCSECKALAGKCEFAIGQKVRIIRNETWSNRICVVARRSEHNPNMYWLSPHGWRRSDEIENA